MSKEIDEKVVEMRFDNKHFETNVKETMSTLDKFKQKLNLTGASKGLENLNDAARKVDMNGLGKSVETVRARFSALEIMGVTALVNITNAAVNAGKRMVKALTIDPVSDGFKEYEMTLNAVQTTMAGTGKTAKEVEKELKKLDEYADKTVYSTADMLNNLPKFTNAGVELEQATTAMIGIANATALAGGDATKASIAFYNLGQAIGTGYLTRMDYNSINNAGIATMEWKEQMIEAAIAAGTLTEVEDGMYLAGNKVLSMQQLFIDGLQEQWATTDVMMEVFTAYGDETTQIGKKAYASAQNIKTFTMMMDSLKATAGTGWKDTWQIIFGDLDRATEFWTGLTNFISGIITKMADFRNRLLGGALGRSFTGLMNTIRKIEEPIKKSAESVKKVTDAVKDYAGVVDEIIGGKWGNGEDRWNALTKAGYDWAHAQNLVNEKLGSSVKHATDYSEAQESMVEAQNGVSKSQEKLQENLSDYIVQLTKLSDAQLKEKGYTDEQIKAFRELADAADKTGIPLKEFIDNIDNIDGRYLLINSFKNIGQSIVTIFKSIGNAWREIFNPITSEQLFNIIAAFHKFSTKLVVTDETADKLKRTFKGLFAIIDIITTLIAGPIKIAFKLFIELLQALGFLPDTILDMTATIGDNIVKFRDWLDSVLDFSEVFEALLPLFKAGISGIGKFFNTVKESDLVKNLTNNLNKTKLAFKSWLNELKNSEDPLKFFIESIQKGFSKIGKVISDFFSKFKTKDGFRGFIDSLRKIKDSITNWFKGLENVEPIKNFITFLKQSKIAITEWLEGLKETDNIGKYIFDGLMNGLVNGGKAVIDFIIGIGKELIENFKTVLGIHSPSRVFFEIGENIVQGLFNGISSLIKMVYKLVMTMGDKLIQIVKNLDIGSIFSLLITSGITYSIFSIAKTFSKLGKPIDGVGRILDNVGDTIKIFNKRLNSIGKAISRNLNAKAFKEVAIGITMLAGSVAVLASLDQGKVWSSVGAIVTLIGVLSGLTYLAGNSGLSKGLGDKKSTINLLKVGTALIGLGIAINLISKALKRIGEIDSDKIGQSIAGIITIVGSLSLMMYALGKTDGKLVKTGGTFIAIAFALLIISRTVKSFGKMDPSVLDQGGKAVLCFTGLIVALMAATKLINGSTNVGKIGSAIFKISGALLMILFVAKIAGKMETRELVKGGLAITAFAGIIVGLIAATKLINGSKNVSHIGGMIASIAGVFVTMILAAKLAGKMETKDLIKGISAVGAFAGIIAGLMAATKLIGGKDLSKLGFTLIAISIAIGLMSLSAALLGSIDIKSLSKGVIAVSFLGLIVAGLMLVAKNTGNAIGMRSLIGISIALGTLILSVGLLSMIDIKNLAKGTTAVSIIMGMLALVIKASSSVSASLGAIIGITIVISVLTGALILISQMPVEKAIGSSIALAILMTSLSGVLFTLSKTSSVNGKAMLGILGLLALCIPLYTLVGILKKMEGIKDAGKNALILGGFLAGLTVIQIACAVVGSIYAATGGMAMLGIVGLVALIASIVALIVGIGALMRKIPVLQQFLDTGIDVLVKLATGIGEMIGGFVSGVLTKLSSSLPKIGNDLSMFMLNLTPFIFGAKTINGDVIKGIGILSGAVLALTATSFIDKLFSLLTFGSSFADLGTELSKFMINALPFVTLSSLIKPESMQGVKTLAEAIMILTGSDILGSLTSWLTGGNSLDKFGTQLSGLGGSLKDFVTSLGTFTEEQVKTVDCAAKAIKAMAEAAKVIPNEGGMWAKLFGDNSLSTFGGHLAGLGANIKDFVTNLGTFSSEQVTTVTSACEAIKSLASAAKTIPNEGGMWAALFGDNSLTTFAGHLPGLGSNLASFVSNLGTFTEGQILTVNSACEAIKALTSAAKTIPNEGGHWAKLFGDNSLSTFAGHLPGLGSNIASFVTNLGTFTEAQVLTVTSACEAIKTISKLGEINVKDMDFGIKTLGINLIEFGKDIKSFADKLNKINADAVSSAVNKVKQLIDLATTAADVNVVNLRTFRESLPKLAKEGILDFVKTLSDKKPKDDAIKAIEDLVNACIKAMDNKKNIAKDAGKSVVNAAVQGLGTDSMKKSAEIAGKNFVSGFAKGIRNNKYLATNAASYMGKQALNAAKRSLDEHSPSKETEKIGVFFSEGLAIGIKDHASKVYKAANYVGEYAKNGLNNTISKISEFMDRDMDSQPTIRPVLDLSDVENGVGYLNGMFNNGPSLGLSANLRSISSGMNRKIQNGSNDDVVSAINKLGKNLGNIGGDTYNVNGVTYDDGSNISNAVQTIVRAVIMEGRV